MAEEKKVPFTGTGTELSTEEKVYSVFAYFGVLCLVSLLLKRDNSYIMFHVRQGIVLFIIEVIANVFSVIPFLGFISFILVMIVCGLLSVIGIIEAVRGNKWEMPFVSEWAKKISL